MLYLETGALPLRFIIAGRRISYLHTLLKRDNTELTKQILMAQSNNPCKGDFIELVQADAQQIGVSCNFEDLVKLSKNVLKRTVKEKVREAAFKYLLEIKSTHSKVAHIHYKDLSAQNYLKNILFTNEEAKLLFELRTKTAKQFKGNFSKMNKTCVHCPLMCWAPGDPPVIDSQEHILECQKISVPACKGIATNKIEYEHLFSDMKKQKEAVILFQLLIEERIKLYPPGVNLDPSTVSSLCCGNSIVY